MTAMNWRLGDIEAALNGLILSREGVNPPDAMANGVVIDSRLVSDGDVFCCIRGDRFDAHDFAEQVIKAGALALIVDRRLDVDCLQWVVRDTREALAVLAGSWRSAMPARVIGVVGSNGKTTTKEMIASVCIESIGADKVLVTQGNFNNEIGVPLTLFRLQKNHAIAVVEMGMNHPGEIAKLAAMAKPNVLVLTNAQREHQEFMVSVDAVARENGTAFESMSSGGVAIFPSGSIYQDLWREQARCAARCVEFGSAGEAEVVAQEGVAMRLRLRHEEMLFHPSFIGEHNCMNAAAAALAGDAVGIPLKDLARGLERFEPVAGRLKVVLSNSNLTLIDDTYNANPDSVRAAIDVLSWRKGKRILILGDMGEVGDQGEEYHQEVIDYAHDQGIQIALLIGDLCGTVALPTTGYQCFAKLTDLIEALNKQLEETSVTVLVKGSRFMKMERVVEALMGDGATANGGHAHVA